MARRHHGMTGHRGMNEAAMTTRGPVRSNRFYSRYANLAPYRPAERFLRRLGAYDDGTGPMVGEPGTEADAAVPAGIAFFGQFVDHEITFDPTSTLGRRADPAAVRNFRTPRLDLDSLYQGGPEATPFLYDDADEYKLLTGPTVYDLDAAGDERVADLDVAADATDGSTPRPRRYGAVDLLRTDQGTALTGDPRNDENLILSQLLLGFVRFHNRVLDHVRSGAGTDLVREDENAFEAASRLVLWHYHWIVVEEFLPSVVDGAVYDAIRAEGRRVYLPDADGPTDEAAIPIEFAVAAYRYGHSQIRDRYEVNDESGRVRFFPDPAAMAAEAADGDLPADVGQEAIEAMERGEAGPPPGIDVDGDGEASPPPGIDVDADGGVEAPATAHDRPTGGESDGPASLAGFGAVPPEFAVDWSYFFGAEPVGAASFDDALQPGRAIDAELPASLFALPFVDESGVRSLAARNLLRGRLFGLPSGQAVAEAMGHEPLANAALPLGEDRSYADYLAAAGRGLDDAAPLWLYVLCEADAQNDGERLGAVGSRLVGEVIHGLVATDRTSYLVAEPDWTPTLPTVSDDGGFRLADLLHLASGPARDGLEIAAVDAAGDDHPGYEPGPDDETDGEAVRLHHAGGGALDLHGYTLYCGDEGQQFEIPDTTLQPGADLTVYTGTGTPADDHRTVCLGSTRPVLNDHGDQVVVQTSTGGVSALHPAPDA